MFDVNFRESSHLSSSGGSSKSNVHREVFKKNKRGVGLPSSFTPGLLKNDAKLDKQTTEKLVKLYEKTLLECGFKLGSSCLKTTPSTWKISFGISFNFQTIAYMDDKQQLSHVTERTLNWIHDTVISGKKQIFKESILTNPDMRISISSTEKVKPDTDLYNKSLPPNAGGVNDVPIEINEKGIPMLRNKNSQVRNARHVKSYKRYTNYNKMDAFITCGSNFSLGLDIERPFCELWLYTDPADLQEAISQSLDEYYLDKFARNVFYTSLKVKNKLDEILNNIGDADYG